MAPSPVLVSSPNIRIGIDLGGTKIEGIALTLDGRELARKRAPSPRGDYGGTIAALADMVAWLEKETHARGTVGIGMPGAISPRTGLVKNANSIWLNGHPFDRDVAEAIGRPVRVANDANCFAVSEAMDGSGAGERCVFAVIIGTGCGGGIVIDGQILVGSNAIGGEWGHNPLPWPTLEEYPGPACYCGKRGCIETWLSGTGFADDYLRATGKDLAGIAIAEHATSGDEAAIEALERYEDRLARALATVVNLIGPDVIVLGGGMSNVKRLYETVPRKLSDWCFSDGVASPVRPPMHGDSSGVRGAAWLWK